MIYKKISIIVLLLLGLGSLLTGCKEEEVSANQINFIEENEVETIYLSAGSPSVTNKITDKLIIDSIINELNSIKFTKLSVDIEKKVLDNGNKLNLDSTFAVQIMGNDEETLSIIQLLSEKELLIVDLETMYSDERTALYINRNDELMLNAVKSIYSQVEELLIKSRLY